MANKGKFIVLEGVDGSGISTQTSLLQTWLQNNETDLGKTFFTKEPTDGPVGCVIRQVLAKRIKPLDEKVMALLFAADRMDHLYCSNSEDQKGGIVEKLKMGINVISDRYYMSSLAYQSIEEDMAWLEQINRHILRPDLTILIQVPVEQSVERRSKSRFQEEHYEKEEFLIKVGKNYEKIASELFSNGENVIRINGSRPREEVFSDIQKAILQLFN
jgi:dTMP kinase